MDITPSSDVLVQNRTRVHQHEHKGLLEGIHFKFPTFKHEHPPVIDVNQVADESMTIGQKVADKVAGTMGSWRFIITQATIMVVWIMLNLVAWFYHWDIYPFVLLNLAMSAQAAFATPLIMMSQNRQSDKDRLTAQNDYLINCKGEEEVLKYLTDWFANKGGRRSPQPDGSPGPPGHGIAPTRQTHRRAAFRDKEAPR